MSKFVLFLYDDDVFIFDLQVSFVNQKKLLIYCSWLTNKFEAISVTLFFKNYYKYYIFYAIIDLISLISHYYYYDL